MISEFLPILLSQIPFRVTSIHIVHVITTWTAVGVLCVMVLVLLSSFFIRWPHTPLDPTTIAGAMYYVADSRMLDDFQGLSMVERKDRDQRIVDLGLRYRFGPMMGVGGKPRVGVDVSKDSLHDVW